MISDRMRAAAAGVVRAYETARYSADRAGLHFDRPEPPHGSAARRLADAEYLAAQEAAHRFLRAVVEANQVARAEGLSAEYLESIAEMRALADRGLAVFSEGAAL